METFNFDDYEEGYVGEFWDHLLECVDSGYLTYEEAKDIYGRFNPLWRE